MYHIPAMSAIEGLTWYGSLGNHDMLGKLSCDSDQAGLLGTTHGLVEKGRRVCRHGLQA